MSDTLEHRLGALIHTTFIIVYSMVGYQIRRSHFMSAGRGQLHMYI